MPNTISLTPAQQVAAHSFTNRVGVVKKPHSLKPERVLEVAPEQLLTSKVLEFELLDFPGENVHQRALILTEVGLQMKGVYVHWYTLLQLEPVEPGDEFIAVFDHYDYARSAYTSCAFKSLTGSSRKTKPTGVNCCAKKVNLMQMLQESQVGFLFNLTATSQAKESLIWKDDEFGLGKKLILD